jgi:murein L,D-transpeptidase YcbB/YkuD
MSRRSRRRPPPAIRLLAGVLGVLALSHQGDARAARRAPATRAPEQTAAVPIEPQGAGGQMRDALSAAAATAGAALTPPEARDLAALYERSAFTLLWTDATGRPTWRAHAGLALLERAFTEGLDPGDYTTFEMRGLAASLAGTEPAPVAWAARFDALMSAAVLRFFRHVHLGKVDPRALGLRISVPDDGHDFAALLQAALEHNRLAETADELTPPIEPYRALRSALVRYRALPAAAGDLRMPADADTVHPGDPLPGLPAIHRLLVTVGDLPADSPMPASGVYDDTMRAGVVRFQQRHGLDPDGVIGRATWAALRVPLAWRVRQIELALERMRWLPDLSRGRLVAVNIPMFRLWAWDRAPRNDRAALTSAVIVGRALATRTPVLAKSLEYVIFRPYWNVPPSILRNEMLPILRRDPGYLARENLEIVDGAGDNAAVLPPTPESIARLGTGNVRLRQRPGPKNALGLIKFVFPNDENVYMHDTPAPQLFSRARRDFSHGCIRIERPVDLAEWVLGADAGWTRDEILAAAGGRDNRRVDLREPIQVVVFYSTALVNPDDGSMHFADDLYRQDEALDEGLRAVFTSV